MRRRSSCARSHHAADLRTGMRAARVLSGRPRGGCAARSASFSARVTYRSLLVVPRSAQAAAAASRVPSMRASRAAMGRPSPRTAAMRSMRQSPSAPAAKTTGTGCTNPVVSPGPATLRATGPASRPWGAAWLRAARRGGVGRTPGSPGPRASPGTQPGWDTAPAPPRPNCRPWRAAARCTRRRTAPAHRLWSGSAAPRRSTPGSDPARPRRTAAAAPAPAVRRRPRRTAADPRCRVRWPWPHPTTSILRSVGLLPIEHGADDAQQVLGFARLRAHHVGGDVVGGVEQLELRRDDHDPKVGEARLLPDEAQELHAVEPGQPEIEEHHVRLLAGELAQRLQPVSGLDHAEPLRTEESRVHPPRVRVVLHQQHEGHADDLGKPWPVGNVNAAGAGAVPLQHAPTPAHA